MDDPSGLPYFSYIICVLDWMLFMSSTVCVNTCYTCSYVCAYCMSLDTGCVGRVGMPQKIFNPLSSSQGWVSCVLLFLCVCMGMFVLRVCKGKGGGLLFFLLFLFFLG